MTRSLAWLIAALPFTALADTPADRALAVAAQVQSQPPAIVLSWPASAHATEFRVARKAMDATIWGTETILPGTATHFSDTAVAPGVAYEYSVYKIADAYSAPGFLCAGIEAPLIEDRGAILLLVDATQAVPLAAEIARLRQDLVGDGWTVLRRDVARDASALRVKELIRDAYRTSQRLRSVFLLGHAPVPYSGAFAPDAHADHEGAWPADAFYGDLDGGWTDATANTEVALDPRIHNVPGDGKFDQSVLPSDVELEVGRVDLSQMGSFLDSEVELLRHYLEKNHAFRHRAFVAERRGLIVDEFGFNAGEPFATTAWGNFWSLFGAAAVAEEPWFPTLSSQSRLWAYACGPGTFSAVGSLDVSSFVSTESHAVFTGLFGSYFGDWDHPDAPLRAPLANAGTGLAAIWAGRPYWYLHPMSQGRTIGFCARLTQNNLALYPPNSAARGVHVALMGDPTLRLHPVAPASNLTAARRAAGLVDLAWSAPAESVAGHHVYRSINPAGPFTRVNPSLLTNLNFTDTAAPTGSIHMVRAVQREETPTGTYWNASQGIFAAADLPRVSIAATRPITSALGGMPAEIVFTRSGSDVDALDIRYTLGGTATNGVHYQPVSSVITIPAGFASATLQIVPAPAADGQPSRTVIVKLSPDVTYSPGVSRAATITIASQTGAFAPYAGRFDDVAAPSATTPSLLSLTLGTTGAFTAVVRVGTEIFRVRGALDDTGAFSGSVGENLALSLVLDVTGGSPALVGTLTRNGGVIANLSARRAQAPPLGLVAPGLYTVALPAAPTAPGASVPEGAGWGLARIGKTGRGSFVFTLGDRTRASSSIAVTEDGSWPIFVPLYRSYGWLAGRVRFEPIAGASDAAGELSWLKSQPAGRSHPAAFDAKITLSACRYTPPGSERRAFAFENVAGNAEWQAESGGLAAPLRKLITIDALNVAKPIVLGVDQLKLRVNAASGTVSGSFVHPVLGRTVTFSGAILQKQARAIGHFATLDRTGTVTVARNPQFSGLEIASLAGKPLRPRIVIDLPLEGTRISEPNPGGGGIGIGFGAGFEPSVRITGRTFGRKPVVRVEFQLVQNGIVSAVQQAEGGVNWEIPLFLGAENAGPLTVFVKAIAEDGNESLLSSRSFTYVVVRNIIVAVNSGAMGSVTEGFLGSTPRELGQDYTIAATPAPGHRFTGWSGTSNSTANPLVFRPSEFFFLRANFEAIP